MAEEVKIKIVGTAIGMGRDDANVDIDLSIDLSLRDLFAAFALMAVIGLNLEEATHESDAIYAYNAADAMLKIRKDQPQ